MIISWPTVYSHIKLVSLYQTTSNNICCKDYQWISKTLSRWKVTVFIKIKQNLVNVVSSDKTTYKDNVKLQKI